MTTPTTTNRYSAPIYSEVLAILLSNIKDSEGEFNFPSPAFDAMQGEILSFDREQGILLNRFPILHEQLNPYGNMQGGIIAAAIDNTIGPLSMLVSTPNFTRNMELKYTKVVEVEIEYIYVKAFFIDKKRRQLFFEAVVEDDEGNRLASAKAKHWVID